MRKDDDAGLVGSVGMLACWGRGEPVARSDEVVISIIDLAAIRDQEGGQIATHCCHNAERFPKHTFNTRFSPKQYNQLLNSTYAAHSTTPSTPSPPSSQRFSRPVRIKVSNIPQDNDRYDSQLTPIAFSPILCWGFCRRDMLLKIAG